MNGAMVFAAAMIILNIIGVVWSGMKLGHLFLVFLGYIIGLIVIGKINGNACLIVALAVAGITFIVIIVMIVVAIMTPVQEKRRQEKKAQRNIDLLAAVNRSDKQTAQKLIAEGVDVNYIDSIDLKNISILQIAVKNGSKDIISLLIENGADVNLVCDGKTPLDFSSDDEIISILKNYGAKTQSELEAAKAAAEAEKKRAAENEAAKKKWQRMLNENLLVAMHNHQTDVAKDLILQGADVNCSTIDIDFIGSQIYNSLAGLTPLMYAIQANDMEMVGFLLKNGANRWKEVEQLRGTINAINFARYAMHNEAIARFLEYS